MTENAVPRRVPWRVPTGSTAQDPRDRIIEAASRCLERFGVDRTSITAIAREAGVSRQTVYNHFTTREDIILEAVQTAATAASERILATARTQPTAAAFVVELCLAAMAEFRRNPAISPLIPVLDWPQTRAHALEPDVIATVRHFLEPILSYLPEREPFLDEMTETYLRFELSLLTIESARSRSPEMLRSYLHRVLVPALGLPLDSHHIDS
ncbi:MULTISPECIES: TetR/AcrR family transcriptional regulator [Nocardia]|uniref:TetR/AcrR family transcriptional regulator n=1 Tax=Nocardia TaxID=1817 RepID=UPI00292E4660|nr:TetR/AcrR family transcriptional regulator [Nocardia canadensis]